METSEEDKKTYERNRIVAKLNRPRQYPLPESKISFYHNQDDYDKEHIRKLYQKSFRRIRIKKIKEKLEELYQNSKDKKSEINKLIKEKSDLERIGEIKEELEELYQNFETNKLKINELEDKKKKLEEIRYGKRTGFPDLKERKNKKDLEEYKDTNHENKIKDLSGKIFVFTRIATGFARKFIDNTQAPSTIGSKEKELSELLFGKDDEPGTVQLRVQDLAKEKEEAEKSEEKDENIEKESSIRSLKIFNIYKNI